MSNKIERDKKNVIKRMTAQLINETQYYYCTVLVVNNQLTTTWPPIVEHDSRNSSFYSTITP